MLCFFHDSVNSYLFLFVIWNLTLLLIIFKMIIVFSFSNYYLHICAAHPFSQARKKEERLVESLKKLEPAESSETTHDPEILTPEEHFFFLKMGLKCKNYVPVGRRGIYQGVILNMHLHWKKHQTLKVVVKTFSPDEVKEIAAELARLSGGIVLDIHEENTIIMYRGKNYSQPPTEIMSPRVTLSRKKVIFSPPSCFSPLK